MNKFQSESSKKRKEILDDLKNGEYKEPKKWKELSSRASKLKRAKSLGIDYPRVSNHSLKKENDV